MDVREKIQKEANEILKQYNDVACLGLSMGLGKSKIVIDRIKEQSYKNILITGYRSSLKDNWKKELEKWGIIPYDPFATGDKEYWVVLVNDLAPLYRQPKIKITIENIQTAYKWTKEYIQQFDLLVFDESHELFTQEFSKLLVNAAELNIPRIALSGTPDYKNKKEFYDKYCPIRMEYYDVEGDITNEVKVIVFQYELTDDYKVLTGNKNKQWYIGEKKQYEYLTEQYEKAKTLMYNQGAENYFEQSLEWMQSKTTTKEQKEAGSKFFYATKNRKEFLWNLNSSATIAKLIKNKILNNKTIIAPKPHKIASDFYIENKVLLFSQLTSQAAKLSQYQIHSKTGNSAKQSEVINKDVLDKFNKGEIREVSSCNSLSAGVNLVGLNYLIIESFDSSSVKFMQRKGRGRRLPLDQNATLIVIIPKGTQCENWAKEMLQEIDYTVINSIKDLNI